MAFFPFPENKEKKITCVGICNQTEIFTLTVSAQLLIPGLLSIQSYSSEKWANNKMWSYEMFIEFSRVKNRSQIAYTS